LEGLPIVGQKNGVGDWRIRAATIWLLPKTRQVADLRCLQMLLVAIAYLGQVKLRTRPDPHQNGKSLTVLNGLIHLRLDVYDGVGGFLRLDSFRY
jgi:hypothetical protein